MSYFRFRAYSELKKDLARLSAASEPATAPQASDAGSRVPTPSTSHAATQTSDDGAGFSSEDGGVLLTPQQTDSENESSDSDGHPAILTPQSTGDDTPKPGTIMFFPWRTQLGCPTLEQIKKHRSFEEVFSSNDFRNWDCLQPAEEARRRVLARKINNPANKPADAACDICERADPHVDLCCEGCTTYFHLECAWNRHGAIEWGTDYKFRIPMHCPASRKPWKFGADLFDQGLLKNDEDEVVEQAESVEYLKMEGHVWK
ncbi:uncharacterized protein BO95DRAFT_38176 [Aspergillus brunneoviolaceus CBS 621.78]|uniref:Uncharacterized protein n=1 Tax=Aspergillus brunneoviolaceus CBS 621.78 TaxID=1450534 RepID=A0ACD1GHX5_9EURO|nr:hypothetical protein BO95DRAFT_38176 [Aspergillus brunneoviolaceus CBS 621.78]RAH48852.1 hypothetical protein BO95DRAFT_38176 [Aspergillus brunneoviolaceus CBS 621.78]